MVCTNHKHTLVEPPETDTRKTASIIPSDSTGGSNQETSEDDYIEKKTEVVDQMCESNAPNKSSIGYQDTTNLWNFQHLHNPTQVRSRGYVWNW